MNDRPTPETKSFYVTTFDVEEWVEKCIRLEKERDEAREALVSREVVIAQQNVITDLLLERDKARENLDDALQEVDLLTLYFESMKQKRDEALSQIVQAECRAERFCQERDEAREKLSATWQSLQDSQDEILRLTFENRELRNLKK